MRRRPLPGLAPALAPPLVSGLAVLLAVLLAHPIPPVSPDSTAPRLDPARAATDARRLSQDFPARMVGSPDSQRAQAWLQAQFAARELEFETLPFTVTVASQPRPGLQLWTTLPGASPEIVLITAAYDVSQAGQGDNAAGVAVLLELARLFAGETPGRSLVFLASDSSAYGHFAGVRAFLGAYPGRERIIAVLNLGGLAAGGPEQIVVDGSGAPGAYAPLWLRQASRAAIQAAGATPAEAYGLDEYMARALPIGLVDHVAFLEAGLPAISLRGGGVEPLGRAAESLVRSLTRLEPLPAASERHWQLDADHVLDGDALDFVQLLPFLPLLGATFLAWRSARPRWGDLQPEIAAWGGVVIAGVDGLAAAFSLLALGLLPRYELFPASPGDPFLLRPAWWAAGVIYGTTALFAWLIFRPFRGWGQLADLLNLPHRRLALLLLFSALALVSWYLDGFAASALLGVAGLTWPLIQPRASFWGKVLNVALALAGALPFLLLIDLVTARGALGPWWWFLPLGAVFGTFPFPGVAAFFVALGLGVRFLRLGLRAPAS